MLLKGLSNLVRHLVVAGWHPTTEFRTGLVGVDRGHDVPERMTPVVLGVVGVRDRPHMIERVADERAEREPVEPLPLAVLLLPFMVGRGEMEERSIGEQRVTGACCSDDLPHRGPLLILGRCQLLSVDGGAELPPGDFQHRAFSLAADEPKQGSDGVPDMLQPGAILIDLGRGEHD